MELNPNYINPYLVGPNGVPLPRSTGPVDRADLFTAINTNYHRWQSNWAPYYLNPDAITLETYERMLFHPTCYAGIEFTILACISRLKEYTHPDTALQNKVRNSISGMRHNLHFAAAEVLTALWAGFSYTEAVYKPGDGILADLDYLQAVHPRSITFTLDTADGSPTKNDVGTVWQWWGTEWQRILPLQKGILYSHRKRFGNVYGQPRFKSVYKPWFISDILSLSMGQAMEKYGSPTTHAKVLNPNSMVQTPSGKTMSQLEQVLDMLSQMKASGTLAGNFDVDMLASPSGMGEQYIKVLEFLDKWIMRGLLVPSLITDHGSNGSRALGQQHFDTFQIQLDQLLDELVYVLIEQWIKPFILLNWGPQKQGYGTFVQDELKPEDLQLLMAVYLQAAQTGFISPQYQADLNKVRQDLGFPSVDSDALLLPNGPPMGPPAPPPDPDDPEAAEKESEQSPGPREFSTREAILAQF